MKKTGCRWHRPLQLLGSVLIMVLSAGAGCARNQDADEDDAQLSATLRPEDSLIFDSSQHPSLSELLQSAIAGFFLSDSVIALVDRTEIHFVDLSSQEHRVVGREGPGPKEFGSIWLAFRTSDGIAVHDGLRRRVVCCCAGGMRSTAPGP